MEDEKIDIINADLLAYRLEDLRKITAKVENIKLMQCIIDESLGEKIVCANLGIIVYVFKLVEAK